MNDEPDVGPVEVRPERAGGNHRVELAGRESRLVLLPLLRRYPAVVFRNLETEPGQEFGEQIDLPHVRRVYDPDAFELLKQMHEVLPLLRLVQGARHLEMKVRTIHPGINDVRVREAELRRHVANDVWRRRLRERKDRRPAGRADGISDPGVRRRKIAFRPQRAMRRVDHDQRDLRLPQRLPEFLRRQLLRSDHQDLFR